MSELETVYYVHIVSILLPLNEVSYLLYTVEPQTSVIQVPQGYVDNNKVWAV